MTTKTPCTRWLGTALALMLGAILSLSLPSYLQAQPSRSDDLERSAGTLYYIAFPDTTTNTHDHQYIKHRYVDQVQLFIYSAVQNKVEISGPTYPPKTKTIPGGKFTVVDLTQGPDRAPQPIVTEMNRKDPAANNSFRIESEQPIVIYCYMVTEFGAEAWTPIPVEGWGMDHFVAAIPGEVVADVAPGGEFDYLRYNKMGPAQLLIVAAYDNTEIAITPTCLLLDYPALVVTLNEGDVYQVQSWVDTLTANANTAQPDLGGTRITSTKPVGVISGNSRAQVLDDKEGLGKNIYKNMLIEWVPPVEQHGTQFAYTPTWDSRRPMGTPGERIEEKRKAEFVRVYGTSEGVTSGFYTDGTAADKTTPFTVKQGEVKEIRFSTPLARMIKTDKPAQVMMHSSAVVKYNGTTQGFGGYIGAQYDGWGPYMVELIAREQWVAYAPYYASTAPSGMEHFLNVVTDSGSARKIMHDNANFILNRPIPGTDLVWGTMSVTPGRDHIIEGKDGAKFFAYVYGLYKGHEEYRPGRARKDDDGGSSLAAAGDDEDPEVLHPSEYEEYVGVAFGYPVAPSRLVNKPGDSLEITIEQICGKMTVTIKAMNQNPVGLRSIRLDSAVNAKITKIDPFPLTGQPNATVVVEPQNLLSDASGVLVIKDRTGKIWRVPYKYFAERVNLTPAGEMNFGSMTPGGPKTDKVDIHNPLDKDLKIINMRLARGNQGFSITEPTSFPVTIGRKDKATAMVTANLPNPDLEYLDTLIIQLECAEVRLPIRAATGAPCLQVDGLDFGTLSVGQSRTLDLELCNNGTGKVTFRDPWLTQFDNRYFTVEESQLDILRNTTLDKGQCVKIKVTFKADEIGDYRTVGRFWANTRVCVDTSVWIATVTKPGPGLTPMPWGDRWVVTANSCTKSGIERYEGEVELSNSGDQQFEVADIRIVDDEDATFDDAPYFDLATDDGNRIIIVTDIVQPSASRKQKVYFRPDAERDYKARVRIITTTGDTVYGALTGTGIESHLSVTPTITFPRTLNTDLSTIPPQMIRVTSPTTATRPLTVTALRAAGANQTAFSIGSPVMSDGSTQANGPWVLVPGDYMDVPARYVGPDTELGTRTMTLSVEGDHSRCDDSVTALSGELYSLGASITNITFPTTLTCFNRSDVVTVTNTSGADAITIVSITPPDNQDLVATIPTTPLTLGPGESLTIPVTYNPTDARPTVNATMTFEVTGQTGQNSWTQTLTSTITASSKTVQAPATIARDFVVFPGTKVMVPLTLDAADLNEASVDKLSFTLYYNKGMMSPTQLGDPQKMLDKTIISNWTATITNQAPGRFDIELTAPAGTTLNGQGTLLNVEYLTFLGSADSSEMEFTVVVNGRECAKINPNPGLVRIDGVCGLDFRLIEAFVEKYALQQNAPNPFNPSTEVIFSLGLDGHTVVDIYNANGEKVATLVDGYLKPGKYTVTWDASGFPSGLYYCHIRSGEWSKTNTMILKK